MKRWRVRICRFTPLAVLLFASGVAVPRQGLVFHQHEGGDHFHVHGDEISGEAHELEERHGHEHHHEHDAPPHHHGAGLDHDDAAFEAPDAVHLGHWHTQDPFHRVVVAAPITPLTVLAVERTAADLPEDVAARPLPPYRARGPPKTSVS